MKGELEVVDQLAERLKEALLCAYDLSEALAAVWLFGVALARAEAEVCLKRIGMCEALGELEGVELELFGESRLAGRVETLLSKNLADRFLECGLDRTGSILRMFGAIANSLLSQDVPNSGCRYQLRALECPKCGATTRHKLWEVVNVERRSPLRRQAKDGQLCNEARCLACGGLILTRPFLYCDSAREEFLLVWPFGRQADASTAISEAADRLAFDPVLRGGKEIVYALTGVPPATVVDERVAAVTVCHGVDEFERIVNESVAYDVETPLQLGRETMRLAVEAKRLIYTCAWTPASVLLAKLFLRSPVEVSRLYNITACLRSAGRIEEANAVLKEAGRLRDLLLQHRLIVRVCRCRSTRPYDSEREVLAERIRLHGLPAEWHFDDLLMRLRALAGG